MFYPSFRLFFTFIENKNFRTFSTLGYEREGAKMLTDILATIVAVNISGLDEDIAEFFFFCYLLYLKGVRNQGFPKIAPQIKKYVGKG